MRFLLAIILVLMSVNPAFAADPDERLDDPEQEARAVAISRQLRCVVCQNQSIDESNAEIARDLRRLVRERIEAGDSDGEVIDEVVARYGEFVLLRPRFSGEGIVLWLTPLILLAGGGGLVWLFVNRRLAAPVEAEPLTPEELRELMALLGKDERGEERDSAPASEASLSDASREEAGAEPPQPEAETQSSSTDEGVKPDTPPTPGG